MRPLLLLTVLSGACTFVEVDADIQALCATRHDVAVEAVPARAAAYIDEVEVESEVDLAELDLFDDANADLRFDTIRFRPTSGVEDMTFIESAHVTVSSGDPASTLPTLTVIDCDGDCPHEGVDLLIPADSDANAADYATGAPLVVGAIVGGELPDVAWTMDIEVCARGTASL